MSSLQSLQFFSLLSIYLDQGLVLSFFFWKSASTISEFDVHLLQLWRTSFQCRFQVLRTCFSILPVLFHFGESGLLSYRSKSLVKLFTQIQVDITKGTHALLLLLKIVFVLPVVLLQDIVCCFHLLKLVLVQSSLLICLFHGFLYFCSLAHLSFI